MGSPKDTVFNFYTKITNERERERKRERMALPMMCGVRRSNVIEILRDITAFPVNARSQRYTKGTWCYLIQRNHKSGARENI